jgi:hypothetical protein
MPNEAGENFAAIRHIALNLLNADKSFKEGLERKRTRAGRVIATYLEFLWGKGLLNLTLGWIVIKNNMVGK